MPKRRRPKHGPFLQVPTTGNEQTGAKAIIGEGGAIDTLSSDAFRLLFLVLERGKREKGVDNKGSTIGPRTCPHSLVQRRFHWSPRKVGVVFKELLAARYVIIEETGGLHAGIRRSTSYRIGSAHPWVERHPTTHGGNDTATHGGNDGPTSEDASLPTVVMRNDGVKTATAKAKMHESAGTRPPNLSLPTGVRDLRSTMHTCISKGAPDGYRIPSDLPPDSQFFRNPASGSWHAKFLGADRRPHWVELHKEAQA